MALLTKYITAYIAILKETFTDIDQFVDNQLESDLGTVLTIACIIVVPVLGVFLFLVALYFFG